MRENDAVLASVAQKAKPRLTVLPFNLGVQSQGAGGTMEVTWQTRKDWNEMEVRYWVGPQKATECPIPRDCPLRTWINKSQESSLRDRKREAFVHQLLSSTGQATPWMHGVGWVQETIRKRNHAEGNAFSHLNPLFFCPVKCSPPHHFCVDSGARGAKRESGVGAPTVSGPESFCMK